MALSTNKKIRIIVPDIGDFAVAPRPSVGAALVFKRGERTPSLEGSVSL
jgi:hypothetical protein